MNPHPFIGSIALVSSMLMPAAKSWASDSIVYQRQDSIKIVQLLRQATGQNQPPKSWMLWFGQQFAGIPYVAGTLDRTQEEVLVVNTCELDCTTYVEMVTALTMCATRGETTFSAFCDHLKHVRYIGGKVSYVQRQHYFTVWIDDNEREGIVTNISPNPPFTALQTVNIDWMSTHTQNYKMLSAHPQWAKGIRQMEASVSGKQYRYIPKSRIANSSLMRQSIHDGDIIAIVTNKKGLDTTHIGIASWHKDGLHLLNASSIHKKVIDEPMTLYQYMKKHPVQIGIRVCRPDFSGGS